MAHNPVPTTSPLSRALRTFRRPWPIILAGLGFTIAAVLPKFLADLGLSAARLLMSQPAWVPFELLLLGTGVLLAGIAVARRLQTASWELEDRAESAGLLAMAAFTCLLAYLSMNPSWDSGSMFLWACIAVSLVGSVLVLLPRMYRRIAALLLVVLHFGGILTAVTAVAPRNEPAPWLSQQLWAHVYRPYLWFAYLTNAYHFYSPDPGPPTLIWFHVEHEDPIDDHWIKIPNKHESPVGLHHQRMLAAAENAYQPMMGPSLLGMQIPFWEEKFHRKYELLPGVPHDPWEKISLRRQYAASIPFTDPEDHNRPAPLPVLADLDPPAVQQYSEPQEIARRLIASYARHIARTTKPIHDNNPIKSVRVYRVVHDLISPRQLSEGLEPWDPTTFKPVYMGKYDPDGHLLDPQDPYLFWLVPIVRVPSNYPGDPPRDPPLLTMTPPPTTESSKIINFVEIHATQSDKLAHRHERTK